MYSNQIDKFRFFCQLLSLIVVWIHNGVITISVSDINTVNTDC